MNTEQGLQRGLFPLQTPQQKKAGISAGLSFDECSDV